jgi:hypothetical protein
MPGNRTVPNGSTCFSGLKLTRPSRQAVSSLRVADEGGARREQQDVIILGADEGVDRQDAVATGSVLDHDRLVPFLGQRVRQ